MKATAKRLSLVLGMLAIATGCTATSNPSAQTEQPQKATEVTNSETVATNTIKIDGSSTVYPITKAIAEEYKANPENKAIVEVKISGTTGGFEKFCKGETDISNASRPILKAEMEICNQNGIRFMEFPIAFDALTVAINPQNDWAKDITIEELKKI
jgi:phosphate transport system substrate-binding protein